MAQIEIGQEAIGRLIVRRHKINYFSCTINAQKAKQRLRGIDSTAQTKNVSSQCGFNGKHQDIFRTAFESMVESDTAQRSRRKEDAGNNVISEITSAMDKRGVGRVLLVGREFRSRDGRDAKDYAPTDIAPHPLQPRYQVGYITTIVKLRK